MTGRFGLGIDDALILPLVLIALAARYLLKATLSILIHILDFAFPVLLQVMRFPLFTVRIIGDGIASLLKAVIGCLPVSGTTREEWRLFVSQSWSWLRQKLSYRAFEQTLHDAFERGMAWVFKTCRALTPGGALLVLAGAVLWLPVSFAAATALHVALIAHAASLPPWTQFLHLLATIIAKSKLLVLPVYPAAWPQAKKQPLVQRAFRAYDAFTNIHFMQKAGYRYRQSEWAMAKTTETLLRTASLTGLGHLSESMFAGLNRLATWIGDGSRSAIVRLSRFPFLGPLVTSYAAHYARAEDERAKKASDKVKALFERWSMKFSAEYYEAKEKDEAAQVGNAARRPLSERSGH